MTHRRSSTTQTQTCSCHEIIELDFMCGLLIIIDSWHIENSKWAYYQNQY